MLFWPLNGLECDKKESTASHLHVTADHKALHPSSGFSIKGSLWQKLLQIINSIEWVLFIFCVVNFV